MAVSNADLTRLIFLDCIEQGLEIPDGCDIEALYEQGLVARRPERWSLTPSGQLLLRNLRSLEYCRA